jgi:aspartate dehydrogenase
MESKPTQSVLRVGVIGYGALGASLTELVARPENRGIEIVGVLDLPGVDRPHPVDDIDALIDLSDVIVEAAGPGALRAHARAVLAAGRTLVAASVGAFLQEDLWDLLSDQGSPGSLILSTGALGGMDLIRASGLADPAAKVTLTSRKRPRSLIQQWMEPELVQRLEDLGAEDDSISVFVGDAREAPRLFPANLNVAGALAIAVGEPTRVAVELIADPRADLTTHHIHVESALGRGDFVIQNHPLERNPATSGVTPWALLRCLRELSPDTVYRFA